MIGTDLLLSGEVAKLYETTYPVISGLANAHNLQPKPIPHNGNAKGWNRDDRKVFARALGRDPESLLVAETFAVSATVER